MSLKDDFSKPKIIQFPKIQDPKGNLTFMQNPDQVPFQIKRTFWTYDVPGGEIRGGHAYKSQQEIIIALSGSFDVIVTNLDGTTEKYSLNYEARPPLLISPNICTEISTPIILVAPVFKAAIVKSPVPHATSKIVLG